MSTYSHPMPTGLDSRLLHQLPLYFSGSFDPPAGSDEPLLRFRLRWIEGPCRWDGGGPQEIFAILDGEVDMAYVDARESRSLHLRTGDVFCFDGGRDFVAVPRGRARILTAGQRQGCLL